MSRQAQIERGLYMNSVILIGNLGRDPEQKFTATGKAVTNFSMAVKRPFSKDETDWINIVAWNKTAELCTQYLKKGSKVAIEGRLQVRDYETSEGQKRYVTEVVANSVEFLDSRNNSTTAAQQQKPDLDDFEDIENADDGSIPF